MIYQLSLSLISGIFIGGVSAYLGTLMLSKKMSVVAGPLAHLAFPGVALALILGFNISLGVFPFVIAGVILIWILERKTSLPMENLAAIIFAGGVGLSLLFLPIDKAEEALVGNINKISLWETLIVVVLSCLIFYVVRHIYRSMMLINIHEDLASVEGANIKIDNLLYLLSIAIIVALGVRLVGGLITVALIAIPAASSKNINRNLVAYKVWAIVFGVLASVLGILIAHFISLPSGPMVIVWSVILFLFSLILHK